jgi:hypothetical protein
MPIRGLALRLAAAGVVASLVVGCSGDDAKDLAPCPVARVMGEPSELTRFRAGPGRDPTDILFEATFLQVAGECSYDADGGDIEIELNVLIDILRGPANQSGEVSFRYFVAVAERGEEIGPQPAVHGRKAFAIEALFPETRRNVRYTDVLEITIPRPDARSVRSYVLYLGFELTPEELAYNRRKLGF